MSKSPQSFTMHPGELMARHAARFGRAGQAFQAPGRVNIIGEHTDYSGGLILPAAINFSTIAVVSERSDGLAVLHSENFNTDAKTDITRNLPSPGEHAWSDYPFGVAWALKEKGIESPGFSMTIAGNVPLGSGLSSSASIEVAVAMALLSLTQARIGREEIALLCQKAENDFVGANCGIMDQFIACFGEEGHAVLVDTRSLEHRAVRVPKDAHIVICNSMVKHSHAGGEYNTRRAEVDAGTAVLRAANPNIRELRDATMADLDAARQQMQPEAFRRCRHIITENGRVEQTAAALEAGDLARVGRLMAEAHASYRDDFEASVPEVEALIEIAGRQPGLIGARLTGGGFGGCTVNLVEADRAPAFRETIREEYRLRTGINAEVYLCRASAGAGQIADEVTAY